MRGTALGFSGLRTRSPLESEAETIATHSTINLTVHIFIEIPFGNVS
jgi:hypothetical protein